MKKYLKLFFNIVTFPTDQDRPCIPSACLHTYLIEEEAVSLCFCAASSDVNNGRQAVIIGPHPLAFTTG